MDHRKFGQTGLCRPISIPSRHAIVPQEELGNGRRKSRGYPALEYQMVTTPISKRHRNHHIPSAFTQDETIRQNQKRR